jgi:membrane fusion protein, multidrug efflux system
MKLIKWPRIMTLHQICGISIVASFASTGCRKSPSKVPEATDGTQSHEQMISLNGSADSKSQEVQTVLPDLRGFDESVEVLGIATPRKVTTVHSLLEGRITGCRKKSGDLVQKGEVICTLDESVVNIDYLRAKNAVESTQRALNPTVLLQQKKLFDAGVIGQLDYEKLRIEVEKATALQQEALNGLSLVEKKRELHKIVAPFEGTIVEMKAQAGQPISPAIPVAVLASTGGMILKSEVPAKYYSLVKIGTEVSVVSVAGQSVERDCTTCAAVVTAKSDVVQVEKQTFVIESPLSLKESAPGILVRSKILLKRNKPSMVIPFASVVEWDSATKLGKVFIHDDFAGRVFLKEILTTDPVSDFVHVRKGMESTDRVVYPLPANISNGAVMRRKKEMSP